MLRRQACRRALALGLLITASIPCACGTNEPRPDEASSSASAGGGSTHAASGAGGATGTSASGGGGEAGGPTHPAICDDYCLKLQELGCYTGSDCPDKCVAGIDDAGMGCSSEATAYMACFVEHGTTCDGIPALCNDELDAVYACGCQPTTCTSREGGNSNTCSCDRTCGGGDLLLDASCTTTAMGSTCDCSINGEVVGTCTGPEVWPESYDEACDLKKGCCAPYLVY